MEAYKKRENIIQAYQRKGVNGREVITFRLAKSIIQLFTPYTRDNYPDKNAGVYAGLQTITNLKNACWREHLRAQNIHQLEGPLNGIQGAVDELKDLFDKLIERIRFYSPFNDESMKRNRNVLVQIIESSIMPMIRKILEFADRGLKHSPNDEHLVKIKENAAYLGTVFE